MEWFRFYTETIHDTKIRRLPPAQRWVWVAVLTMASQSPKPGHLLLSDPDCNVTETLHVTDSNVSVTTDDLADIARVDVTDVETAIANFIRQKMLHVEDGVFVVTNWGKRQYISDSSADRVRRHREKKRNGNVTETLHVTNRNATVTPSDTETDTETDKYKKPVVKDIVSSFEQIFARLPNGIQIDDLTAFACKGMELSLIVQAMRKTRQMDKPVSYLFGILRNMVDSGILTMADGQAEQARREAAAASHTPRTTAHNPKDKPKGHDPRYAAFYELFPDE